MNQNAVFIALLMCAGIFFHSCKSDPKASDDALTLENLMGNWELVKAYRNNSPTTTLNGAYFKLKDELLETNVLGQDDNSTYSFSGDTIYQHNSGFGQVNYLVGFQTDSTMSLFTSLRGVRFELEFVRAE